jgi:O-methyltransferase involved in polyketide biosynthesis
LCVDFQKQSLLEGVEKSGYDTKITGFFSWLEVISYLSTEAIFETLRTVASLQGGRRSSSTTRSRPWPLEIAQHLRIEGIVPSTTGVLDEESRRMQAILMDLTAARGEPILSLFERDDLVVQVRELEFDKVWDSWATATVGWS